MSAEEERKKWEAGYRLHAGLGEVYISREIGKLQQLAENPKPRRTWFMRKEKQANSDNRQLQNEFRAFLQTVKENAE